MGLATHAFTGRVRALGHRFSVSYEVTDAVVAAIRGLQETDWSPAIRQDDTPRPGAAVAEITDRVALAEDWPSRSRLIVRREPLHSGAQQTIPVHDLVAKSGSEPDDIFLIKRDEIDELLYDLYSAWAVGAEPRGPVYWPREIERRRRILDTLEDWSPPRALGNPPEVVTEPFTIMLWGITTESIETWLGSEDDDGSDLSGFAASPGVVEGTARVLTSAEELDQLEQGEILVAPITAPSWAPVFGRITAAVTDIGGVMSHAAIVCREYGLPAVTGTAYGTRDVTDGMRLRVDGNAGTVTILD